MQSRSRYECDTPGIWWPADTEMDFFGCAWQSIEFLFIFGAIQTFLGPKFGVLIEALTFSSANFNFSSFQMHIFGSFELWAKLWLSMSKIPVLNALNSKFFRRFPSLLTFFPNGIPLGPFRHTYIALGIPQSVSTDCLSYSQFHHINIPKECPMEQHTIEYQKNETVDSSSSKKRKEKMFLL